MAQSPSEGTEVEAEKPAPQPLFFVDELWPCYLVSDQCKQADIRAMNLPIAYLLTNVDSEVDNKKFRRPALMKMMNGAFGYACVEVSMDNIGMGGVSVASASMKLPKLPWTLVTELDMFFRSVFDKIGTESIVMLTYDLDKLNTDDESSGWDYYVPTQENTAGDCTYSKDEILEQLADKENILLAGSVHSHPEMSAFFSGTDHKDQADWEGLHITYGWPKGGLTEYHIEMILAGKQWTYQPHQVFEIPPPPALEGVDFTDVMKRVSKEVPKSTSYGVGGYYGGQQAWQSTVGTPPGGTTGTAQRPYTHSGPTAKQPAIHVPKDCPDPRKNLIVAVLTEGQLDCRFCGAPITDLAHNSYRCYACASFMVDEGMDLEDLIQARTDQKLPESNILKLDPEVPIYFWSILPKDEGGMYDLFDLVAGEVAESAKKS